jgi:hypothetical protein
VSDHNPGTGNPRLFSQSDVVKVAVAAAMARIGVPMRHLQPYAELVRQRARQLVTMLGLDVLKTDTPKIMDCWLALFPVDDRDGKWVAIEVNGLPQFDHRRMPPSYSVLQVDRIIHETFRRIGAFEKGQPIPRTVLAQIKDKI